MRKFKYDYLLVGAGLFNAIFAYEASKIGKKCLVIDKRSQIGGNLYCATIEGIRVHKYGAHIFHTKNKNIWDYMSQLCEFNNYVNSPLAFYEDELYNLPFNMNTFFQLWGVKTPKEAMLKIESQRERIDKPQNFEEQALSLVGADIYNKLIKGYTEKQWGMNTRELPSFLIKRIPLRFTFDNNYFNDPYQGIPLDGYNPIFKKCFQKSDIILNTDFINNRNLKTKADKIIYTGTIDQYYDFCFGELGYRSLKFKDKVLNTSNYQGNAVINYTDSKIPYTRILEHKHFAVDQENDKTVITYEYPITASYRQEPYYPINTDKNNELYKKYRDKAKLEKNIIFAGRLGSFTYYDMDQTVNEALTLFKKMNS